MEFALFQAKFADLNVVAEAKGPFKQGDLAKVLSKARCVCARKAHDFAPIDKRGIEAFAAKAGKLQSVSQIAKLLRGTSLGKLEAEFNKFVKFLEVDESKKQAEAKKAEYAIDYYLYLLFSQVFAQDVSATGGAQKGEVRLVANTSEWKVVKKVDLAAEPKEVLAAMIGIAESARKKHPDFLCKEIGAFEEACSQFLSKYSPRKSFGKLVQVLEGVSEGELEQKLGQIASAPSNVPVLKELFYLEALAQAGFSPYLPVGLLNETYPELKIPKPRGNFGGKGKKKK